MPTPPRRTQAERRSSTRAIILEAALDSLVEHGLAGFTTTAVMQQAGLSQGALFKHFGTKAELLAEVTEHLFDGLRADFEERFQALPEQDRTPRQGVDLLWTEMFDPRLAAAYELYTAARTDTELRESLQPVVERHLKHIEELATALVGSTSANPTGAASLVILALQGLVVNQMAWPSERHIVELRAQLDQLVDLLMEA